MTELKPQLKEQYGKTPEPPRDGRDVVEWAEWAEVRREEEGGAEVEIAVEKRSKLESPKRYRVLLHNDNYTTRDFVVLLLQSVFNKNELEAVEIMLHIHHSGVGVAGIYTFELAETKMTTATSLARQNEYPLLCTMEPD